ncbi:insulinase family protein [Pseudokineococcus marinus]|uniref:Insulinase family protein n=1 Tax=Pseudokineococcus marinus TaxID=351215 RepID=A0A849BM16_9ACTN|nr:insulinase family protein [Pseudokineococcus marinus]NNH24240.1 insulinase family protein [Pseudokineococcus marinus]
MTTELPPLHRSEVDGVPVLWREGPGPLTAGLVLGVGRRDETFTGGGTTHLLEHLVMHEARRPRLECNASVGIASTELTVTGRPDRVVEFLARACRLLADPPVERREVEARVLAAEEREEGPDLVGALLVERFGYRGPGLVGAVEPALGAVSAEALRAWSARWAVSGAAACWLTGPPPEGLALPLPARRRPDAVDALPEGALLPGWTQLPGPVLAVSGLVPVGPAAGVALHVLRDRLEEELRHRRGLTYGVDSSLDRLTAVDRHALLATQVREGAETEAFAVVREVLAALAADGPTDAELAGEVESAEETLTDQRTTSDELSALAEAAVLGWPVEATEELLASVRDLTIEDVRDAARHLERSALVAVPEGVDLEVPGLPRLPDGSGEVVEGRVHRPRLLRGVPRGARLVVGGSGASLDLGGGQVTTVRWEEVVGLVEAGDADADFTHQLVSARGLSIPLQARDWRGGDEALRAVLAAVPERLHVRGDPEGPSRRADRERA